MLSHSATTTGTGSALVPPAPAPRRSAAAPPVDLTHTPEAIDNPIPNSAELASLALPEGGKQGPESIPKGDPIEFQLEGQTEAVSALQSFVSPQTSQVPGLTPEPATNEAQTLLNSADLTAPETGQAIPRATELAGAQQQGSLPNGETGLQLDAAKALLDASNDVSTHLQNHAEEMPAHTTPEAVEAAPATASEVRNSAANKEMNLQPKEVEVDTSGL